MPAVLLGVLATTTGPQGPNESEVSPGLLGFLTVFFLALATVVLVRSMVKHLRKVRYGPGPDGQPWTPPPPVGTVTPAGPGGAQEPAARTPDAVPSDGEEPAGR